MNFYYDPIFGLVYSLSPLLEINLDLIPKNLMSWKEALDLLNTRGVILEQSFCAVTPILNITSKFIR